jgi:hypothetical protein
MSRIQFGIVRRPKLFVGANLSKISLSRLANCRVSPQIVENKMRMT